jgi:hypothetical protein
MRWRANDCHSGSSRYHRRSGGSRGSPEPFNSAV